MRETNSIIMKDLADLKTKCASLNEERQKAESVLLDTIAEVNVNKYFTNIFGFTNLQF